MQQANECENNLVQQMHTLTSGSWQQQVETIKGLKSSPHLVKLINHRNYSSEIAALFAAHNPRTKLITALADFLVELFSTSANQLVPFANLLVSNECIIRLLASGNKVVSSSANEIMKSIIGNLDFRTKGKQVKFVPALEQEFLQSRNNYVREKISLYFLLISTSFYYSTRQTLAEFQRKVVKEGLQDANQKVRANMRQILENIHHFEKQNNFVEMEKEFNRKSTQKVSLKSTKITKGTHQNKSLKVLNNSSMNQSSIIQSFVEQDREKGVKNGVNQEAFEFYLERLRNGSTWSMILLAYQSLLEAINRGFLAQEGSDQLYCDTLQTLIPYLTQKRSKLYESSSKTFNFILLDAQKSKRTKVINFCQERSVSIIQQIIKNQSVACLLLPTLISLNPSFFIAKIAEASVSVKVTRQKWLLLDSIVTNLQHILEDCLPGKGNKKVSAMVKAMCQHVEQSTIKEKQVSLAALAIISQLKSKYPDEVLTALLCQSDKSLSRILELAESIDPSLKIAIIDYISSLKASSKKNSVCRQSTAQRKPIAETIQMEMIQISQQKVLNLNKLGQMVLTHSAELDSKLYKKLISLLEFLCSSDLIMQYKILMEQLTKISGKQFLLALIEVLTSGNCGQESKVREFHDLLLLELLDVRIHECDNDAQDSGRIVKCLIEVYRSSQSLKKRNMTVELLTKIHTVQLGQWLSEDELLLVETYQTTLEEKNF